MTLNRTDILSRTSLTTEDVPVPEWGGSVRVRELSALEYDRYQQSMITMRGKSAQIKLANATAKIVALGCVDEAGTPLFTADDVEALGELSAAALNRVAAAIQRLSHITEGDVKDLTANFTAAPSADSITS